MATDDGELTFIRCPSCSSLIPAVAARCRMCGHGLEEEVASAADENGKSRIRHRKATNHSGVLKDFSLGDEPTYEAKSLRDEALADSRDDKRKSSIDEVFDVEQDAASSIDIAEGDSNSQDDFSESEAIAGAAFDDDGDGNPLDNILGKKGASNKVSEELNLENSNVVEKPKKKRKRKPRNKAFSNTNGSGDANSEIDDSLKSESQKGGLVDELTEQKKHVGKGIDENEGRNKVVVSPSTTAEESVVLSTTELGSEQETEVDREIDLGKVSKDNAIEPVSDLPLVGWLVNYNGNTCSTIEVREGRFFISAESVKGADLVIENMNLSVPHCLVRASTLEGLRIQDLMSDGGTFVKKQTDGEFRKIDDSTVVEHGDWLRAGDYEALVCLIPFRQASV